MVRPITQGDHNQLDRSENNEKTDGDSKTT